MLVDIYSKNITMVLDDEIIFIGLQIFNFNKKTLLCLLLISYNFISNNLIIKDT